MLQAFARGIAAILLGVQLATWTSFLPVALSGHADFRQLYTAGFMLRSGHRYSLYDYEVQRSIQNSVVSREVNALPFNHLAYESLLFVWLSFMPYRAAYLIFLALNSAVLLVIFRMLRSVFDLGYNLVWMVICFLPVSVALMQGQDSIILLGLFSAAFLQLSRGKDISAGVLLGLGFFKFQLVLPIAVLFFCWRRWRFCITLFATAVATIAASILLTGWYQSELYLQSLMTMSTGLTSESRQVMYGISPADMPNLRGLVYGISNGHLSGTAQYLIILISSLVMLAAVAMITNPRAGTKALVLSITTSAIVSYHLLVHDWSILLIPILAVANHIRWREDTARQTSLKYAIVLVMFLAPLLLAFGRNHFYLGSLSVFSLLLTLARSENATFCE